MANIIKDGMKEVQISVVMSVYNAEEYVAETIQSVIRQTYKNWEFIIIDDCSTDRSAEVIESFCDSRIRFFRNSENKGQCENLNRGIALAQGKYIARLDHDDICYPKRFQCQLDYMEEHPDVVLCGAGMDIWKNGEILHTENPPIIGPEQVAFSILFGNYCIAHSSFFIRRSAMIDNGIKYGQWQFAEDYDLIVKLVKIGKIDYIRKNLVIYRIFDRQVSQTLPQQIQKKEICQIKSDYLMFMNFADREILSKAIKRNLQTRKEYVEFLRAFVNFAEYCGVCKDRKELKKNKCMKYVYWDVMHTQPYSFALFFSYLVSPLKDDRYLSLSSACRYVYKYIFRKILRKEV